MTQRWKITIEYDGGAFAGWQKQDNGFAVQTAIEDAIFKFCGEQVNTIVAGRTDSGVHALGQVAHFDLEKDADEKTVRDAVNFHLRPNPVALVSAEKVPTDFNARMSALKRVYCYKILSARRAEPIIDHERVWNVCRDMDVDAMQNAAKHLIGHHDFSTFRASECQAKSPMRTLDRLDVAVHKHPAQAFGQHIEIWAEARSFLHHQIRNIAGTLKLVGEGKWTPDDVKTALEARDRTKGGPMAPAHGLYFVRVEYPRHDLLYAVDTLL